MPTRTFIVLSVPDNFTEKLLGFIHNVNALNSDREPPIEVEEVYKVKKTKTEYAAVPKEPQGEPDNADKDSGGSLPEA